MGELVSAKSHSPPWLGQGESMASCFLGSFWPICELKQQGPVFGVSLLNETSHIPSPDPEPSLCPAHLTWIEKKLDVTNRKREGLSPAQWPSV